MFDVVSAKTRKHFNPYVLGALLGLVIVGSMFVVIVWFPKIGDAWDKNDSVVRDTWFTFVLFGLLVSRLWNLRKRLFFWVMSPSPQRQQHSSEGLEE